MAQSGQSLGLYDDHQQAIRDARLNATPDEVLRFLQNA
jgi:hypothetical protein